MATLIPELQTQATTLAATLEAAKREGRGDGPNTGGKLGPDELQRKTAAAATQFSAFVDFMQVHGNSCFV